MRLCCYLCVTSIKTFGQLQPATVRDIGPPQGCFQARVADPVETLIGAYTRRNREPDTRPQKTSVAARSRARIRRAAASVRHCPILIFRVTVRPFRDGVPGVGLNIRGAVPYADTGVSECGHAACRIVAEPVTMSAPEAHMGSSIARTIIAMTHSRCGCLCASDGSTGANTKTTQLLGQAVTSPLIEQLAVRVFEVFH